MTSPAPAAGDRYTSYVVEASAGTGKTTRLVRRIIELICAGASIDRIVAVTYMIAAAGDMKVRLREELDRRIGVEQAADQRERLLTALRHLEKAFIGTIHSFCANILSQRPVEAGLDPQFQTLAEMESARLFNGVFRTWFEERLAVGSPTLNRALSRLSYMDERQENPAHRIRKAAREIAEWRDMDAAWKRLPFEPKAEMDQLLDRLLAVGEGWRALTNLDRVPKGLRDAAKLIQTVEVQRAANCPEYDAYEAALCSIGRKEADPDDFRFERSGNRLEADFESWRGFREAACEFRKRADADFAAALRDELWEVVERYQSAKLRAGQVDFTDLLVATRDLMQNDKVRAALQARYDHILIDEFQDTDPLQAEVLMLLASADPGERDWRKVIPAPGKLFIVADPKQSIFRFRRADLEAYQSVYRQVIEGGAQPKQLKSSYRSLISIQRFVNSVFQNLPAYLPLCDGREGIDGQPGVVSLRITESAGKRGKPAKYMVERHAPSVTAGFVEWLCNRSGWQVFEKGRSVPIHPRHICILFRRFQSDTTADYVRAFERRNIPHLLVGSKSLHGREEVGVIRNALLAIEWPRDEFSVYATIRGPMFGVADSALALYRHRHQRLNPVKVPDEARSEFAAICYALDCIAQLHRSRNYEPLAVTLSRLLSMARAHASFAFRPGGIRVLSNVNRLIDLARRFDATAATSFRSFVEFLESEAAASEATEAPLLEHEGDGVRLMTVHKAKGLEFPVVILADPTCHLVGTSAGSRWVNKDARLCAQTLLGCAPQDVIDHQEREKQAEQEEAWRLAYVAATRARDLLVVTTSGSELGEGWLSPLEPTLASLDEIHSFDTKLLASDPEMFDGIEAANRAILEGDAEPGLSRYNAWKQSRAESAARGVRRSNVVVAATQLESTAGVDEIPVEILSIETGMTMKSSRNLGKLVHAVLQDMDLTGGHNIGAVARAHGRRLRASNQEIAAATAAAGKVTEHPALKSSNKQVAREFPFVLRLNDGRIVEGTIDFAIRSDSGWLLLDFKVGRTDHVAYERQMQIYAAALRGISAIPVRACLVEIN